MATVNPRGANAARTYLGAFGVTSGVLPGTRYAQGNFGSGTTIKLGVEADLGAFDVAPIKQLRTDRCPNLPSGYSSAGAATYGSGKQNPTVTFQNDYSTSHTSGTFNYAAPRQPAHKIWADFSS